MRTVWVLGDQLNRAIGALADAEPESDRILLIESAALLDSRRWHRQRAHLVITAMRRFATELGEAGFEVDLRRAASLRRGLSDHIADFGPDGVTMTEPNSWSMRQLVEGLDIELVRSNQFLCHYERFAEWANERGNLRLEDFYRWHRRGLGYLMDGDEPVTGRWNYDRENRESLPSQLPDWPDPQRSRLDEIDRDVLDGLPATCFGAEPDGTWATSRRAALSRLRHFVDHVLPMFGPHEDAMTTRSWHLAHSVLSPYLNLGLLLPGEVCDAVQDAHDAGRVEIASAEGFIRQVIGWREYVWGVYWLRMPGARSANHLGADRPLPPVLVGEGTTDMRCLQTCLDGIDARGYNHHIAIR